MHTMHTSFHRLPVQNSVHNVQNPALAWCRKFYKVQEIDWTIRTKEEMQAAEQKGNLVIFECFDPRA